MNKLVRTISSPLRKAYWSWRFDRLSRENTRCRPEDFPSDDTLLRVGWVLAGDERLGSARVKGFLIDRHLREKHTAIFSRILYYPQDGQYLHNSLEWKSTAWKPFLDKIDVLSFQPRTGGTIDLLKECNARGIGTVFSLSDLSMDRIPKEVFEMSDALVVSSDFLAENVRPLHDNVVVIDDPIEVPAGMQHEEHERGKKPELVWLGHPDHWPHVEFLKKVLDVPDFEGVSLRTITRHPEATHQWDPISVWENASHSDIAVIPTDQDEKAKSRSSNRLTALMELGYPVIAGRIPAYEPHLQHGVNGFFADSLDDWRYYLKQLLDPEKRKEMGRRAKATSSLDALRLPAISAQWSDVFHQVKRK